MPNVSLNEHDDDIATASHEYIRKQQLMSRTLPRNILAAALKDSAAVVAMVTCITLASFLMMYCITPQ